MKRRVGVVLVLAPRLRRWAGDPTPCALHCRAVILRRIALVFALGACVPTTEELLPRGAAGVVVEPSAATGGEPIVTADGWTVRFEKFAFMAVQYANTSINSVQSSTEPRLWGATRAETYIPALPTREYNIDFLLYNLYIVENPTEFRIRVDGLRVNPGIDPALVSRFLSLPDNYRRKPYEDEYSVNSGPAIAFVLRAEMDGRVVSMELALDTRAVFIDSDRVGTPIAVRANSVAFATWEVHAERVLAKDPDGPLYFAHIAAADDAGDKDGRVTAAELRAIKMDPTKICDEFGEEISEGQDELGADGETDLEDEPSGAFNPGFDFDDYEPSCPTLIDRLATRARKILTHK